MTPLILDTGPIAAALNAGDPDHKRCAALIEASNDLLGPGATLVEVDYWLIKLATPQVEAGFVADINRVAHPTHADLARASELELEYADRPWLG